MFEKGILLHTGSVRDLPLFHRGTVSGQDPGAGFYLDTILLRTTFLTLPFALVGLLAIWSRRQEERVSFLLLLDFACFFFVQMSLSGWKDGRYVLPILLIADVFAARGLVWWGDHLLVRGSARFAAVAGLLVLQAIVVFSHSLLWHALQ